MEGTHEVTVRVGLLRERGDRGGGLGVCARDGRGGGDRRAVRGCAGVAELASSNRMERADEGVASVF